MKREYIGYDDFFDQIWGGISAKVVSPDFMIENREYVENLTYDIYRIYDLDNNVSFKTLRKMLEYFLQNSFKHKINYNFNGS